MQKNMILIIAIIIVAIAAMVNLGMLNSGYIEGKLFFYLFFTMNMLLSSLIGFLPFISKNNKIGLFFIAFVHLLMLIFMMRRDLG